MENNTNQLNSMLCKRNCGFFGNAACDGYCSKCYKDHVKRQNSGSVTGRVTPTTGLTSNSTNLPTEETIIQAQSPSPVQVVEQPPIVVQPPSPVTTPTAPIPIPPRNSSCQKDETSTCESVPLSSTADMSPMGAESLEAGTSLSSSAGILSTSEKKKRNRCVLSTCKRKVGLTGFDCRCGGLYCWEHRYSDKHNCKFDYKELGQDQIRKNNPIVVGEKIQKI